MAAVAAISLFFLRISRLSSASPPPPRFRWQTAASSHPTRRSKIEFAVFGEHERSQLCVVAFRRPVACELASRRPPIGVWFFVFARFFFFYLRRASIFYANAAAAPRLRAHARAFVVIRPAADIFWPPLESANRRRKLSKKVFFWFYFLFYLLACLRSFMLVTRIHTSFSESPLVIGARRRMFAASNRARAQTPICVMREHADERAKASERTRRSQAAVRTNRALKIKQLSRRRSQRLSSSFHTRAHAAKTL